MFADGVCGVVVVVLWWCCGVGDVIVVMHDCVATHACLICLVCRCCTCSAAARARICYGGLWRLRGVRARVRVWHVAR